MCTSKDSIPSCLPLLEPTLINGHLVSRIVHKFERLPRHSIQDLASQKALLRARNTHRGRNDIANLATIEPILEGILVDPFLHVIPVIDAFSLPELVEKIEVDFLCLLLGQVFVLDGEMDSRLHSDVESSDAVGGQYQDAFVVLQNSQEHLKKSVMDVKEISKDANQPT